MSLSTIHALVAETTMGGSCSLEAKNQSYLHTNDFFFEKNLA